MVGRLPLTRAETEWALKLELVRKMERSGSELAHLVGDMPKRESIPSRYERTPVI